METAAKFLRQSLEDTSGLFLKLRGIHGHEVLHETVLTIKTPGGRREARGGTRKEEQNGCLLRAVSSSLLVLSLLVSFSEAGGSQTGETDPPAIRDDLDVDSLRQAIQRSVEFLAKLPQDQIVGERPRKITVQQIKESLLSFVELLDLWGRPAKMAEAIRSRFDILPSAPDPAERELLVTGYYQPVIEGSLTETAAYRFPIYRKPDDLIEAGRGGFAPQLRGEKIVGQLVGNRLVPYFSRYEIDALGRLKGKGYEIAWVKDPVELFFLHVQGSGIIRLEDGRMLQVNYAATNGRAYTSIGKTLIDSGKIPEQELSAARLRRFLREHSQERDALFARNERYVFFRFVESGPLGSLEVPLTPGRSVATDPSYFPKGALAFLVSHRPILDAAGNLVGWQPFSRFVLSQDAGGAIRGPGRLDLYFGSGAAAGEAAGFMKSSGRLYFLLKKKVGRE